MLKLLFKLLMWIVFGYWPRRKEELKKPEISDAEFDRRNREAYREMSRNFTAKFEAKSPPNKWWIVAPHDSETVRYSVTDIEPPQDYLFYNHGNDGPWALGPFSSYELACKARCEQNSEDYLAVKEELYLQQTSQPTTREEVEKRLDRVFKECKIDEERLLASLQRRRDARRAAQQTKTQSTPSPSSQENAKGSADDEKDSVAPASPPEL